MTALKQAFFDRVAAGTCQVGIVGMGYVGLPLALAFVERAGLKVTGFDIDAAKVQALERGQSYLLPVEAERVAAARAGGLFSVTTDFDELQRLDAVLIAVPTPLTPAREPDLTSVVRAGEAVAERLQRGQLVVLESTTYPGTTDGLLREVLERSGLASGRDFFLAFSPEREDPGNRTFSTATIPKLVGGVDAVSGEVATALYARALEQVVLAPSARVAEAAKLTENVFRSVNMALVNELKVVFDRMGIDVWDVLDAAATKPFGFMRFDPGPGPGGHCIPIDPHYLAWKAREAGSRARFVELAAETNAGMPSYVVEKLADALRARGEVLEHRSVLVLGVAYKRDIDDPRESPAVPLVASLRERGARVAYHDPHVPRLDVAPHALESQPLSDELVAAHDAVLLCTDHTGVDYARVLEHARLIVDTRGVYRLSDTRVVKA